MEFSITKELALVRELYRKFAENEVKPLAAIIDEEERFPVETIPKLTKAGLLADRARMTWPMPCA